MDEGIDQQAESLIFLTLLTLLLFILLRNEAHAYFEELFANPADVLWIKKKNLNRSQDMIFGTVRTTFSSS